MTEAGPAALETLPDAVLAPARTFARGRRPRLVATGYGGSFRSSFSGSSYYLTLAGIRTGALDGGFTLYASGRPDRRLQARGAAWKVGRALRRESSSGFKFSPEFSDHVWHRHLQALAGTDIVNNFQLFSGEVHSRRGELGIRTAFYLDGTFTDYLRGYRDFDVDALDEATVARAIEAERDGYAQVDTIVAMSGQVASSLQEVYGVDPARIETVLPGANISEVTVAGVAEQRQPFDGEFTVGFVGVYPERKGLPKLAAAIALLRDRHVRVRLLVVGRCPEAIGAQEGVTALGVIDKASQAPEFAAAMSRIDLGCQLSTVEMWGIAALEFVRCGIPVLGTEVGGIPDMVSAGGVIGVPSDVTVEEVAETIGSLVEDRAAYDRLASAAAVVAPNATWERAATELRDVLDRLPR